MNIIENYSKKLSSISLYNFLLSCMFYLKIEFEAGKPQWNLEEFDPNPIISLWHCISRHVQVQEQVFQAILVLEHEKKIEVKRIFPRESNRSPLGKKKPCLSDGASTRDVRILECRWTRVIRSVWNQGAYVVVIAGSDSVFACDIYPEKEEIIFHLHCGLQ